MSSKSKWTVDFTPLDTSLKRSSQDPPGFVASALPISTRSSQQQHQQQQQSSKSSKASSSAAESAKLDATASLKIKKAWDVALAPAKSIPMQAFMLWMSGNSVQIFSIIITVMLLWNSSKAIFGVNNVFKPYNVSQSVSSPSSPGKSKQQQQSRGGKPNPSTANPLLLPKLAYVLFQFALFGMGLYKCGGMGLLPTATSDWLAFMEGKRFEELLAL